MECVHVFEKTQRIVAGNKIERCKMCMIERVVQTLNIDTQVECFSKASATARCAYRSYTTQTADTIAQTLPVLEKDPVIQGEIEDLYNRVIQGDTLRFPFNRSVLIVCALSIYKSHKRFMEYTRLQTQFDISRKQMSGGVKYFNLKVRLNNIQLKMDAQYISVGDYIHNICIDLNINEQLTAQCIQVYDKIKDKCDDFNYVMPKVVAVAMVKYFMRNRNHTEYTSIFEEVVRPSKRLSKKNLKTPVFKIAQTYGISSANMHRIERAIASIVDNADD